MLEFLIVHVVSTVVREWDPCEASDATTDEAQAFAVRGAGHGEDPKRSGVVHSSYQNVYREV